MTKIFSGNRWVRKPPIFFVHPAPCAGWHGQGLSAPGGICTSGFTGITGSSLLSCTEKCSKSWMLSAVLWNSLKNLVNFHWFWYVLVKSCSHVETIPSHSWLLVHNSFANYVSSCTSWFLSLILRAGSTGASRCETFPSTKAWPLRWM